MPTAKRFPRANRAGGYEKPQTAEAYVKKYGADVVRLWVASQDYRNDIVVSEERINKVGETYRGIRNALRYQLSNLYDFDPAKHTVPDDQLDRPGPLDSRRVFQTRNRSHRRLRPLRVPRRLSEDQPVRRRRAVGHLSRRGQGPALHRRRRIRRAAAPPKPPCIALSPASARCSRPSWPLRPMKPGNSFPAAVPSRFIFPNGSRAVWRFPPQERDLWKSLLNYRNDLLPGLEEKRQAKTIGKSLEAAVRLFAANKPFSDWAADPAVLEAFRELCNVSQIEITRDQGAELVVQRRRPEMRALLALGNRRWLQHRIPYYLRPLHRGCQAARRQSTVLIWGARAPLCAGASREFAALSHINSSWPPCFETLQK